MAVLLGHAAWDPRSNRRSEMGRDLLKAHSEVVAEPALTPAILPSPELCPPAGWLQWQYPAPKAELSEMGSERASELVL